MWSALIFAIIAVPFGIGTMAYSIATGRLVYAGVRHVTRADDPGRFWFWIAFVGFWCILVLFMTVPRILAGQ